MTYLTESQARDGIHRMLAEMAAADGVELRHCRLSQEPTPEAVEAIRQE